MYQQGFIQKGYAPNEALSKVHQIMDLSVTKQATVLTYMDVFLYLGVLFFNLHPGHIIGYKERSRKTSDDFRTLNFFRTF